MQLFRNIKCIFYDNEGNKLDLKNSDFNGYKSKIYLYKIG